MQPHLWLKALNPHQPAIKIGHVLVTANVIINSGAHEHADSLTQAVHNLHEYNNWSHRKVSLGQDHIQNRS